MFSLALGCALSTITVSCTTSQSVVSQSADLSKYKYASVINNDTYHIPAELMEYEIMLFDAVEASRLKLISDMRLYELTPEQQAQLLIVKYGVNIRQEETCGDGQFHRLSFRSSCRLMPWCIPTLGISSSADMKGAIKRAEEQISQTFPKKINKL